MPKKQYHWQIYRLRGTPAQYVGSVYAPDEKTAIKRAVEEYEISDVEQQKRLIARRES